MQGYGEDAGVLQKTFRLENRSDGSGGDDRGGSRRHRRPHHIPWARTAPLHDFLCGRGRRRGVSRKSKIARRKNTRAAGGNSHGNICLAAGSPRQNGRPLEGEEKNWSAIFIFPTCGWKPRSAKKLSAS